MVVNSILVAIVAHANHPNNDAIYHVGSSVRRPLMYSDLQEFGFRHFTAKPWINKDGKPVKVGKVTVFSNMDNFRRFMFIRYLLMLKVSS
jgi:alcohol-forming fatty acyl-CoA reductase